MDERITNLLASLCGDDVTDETRLASLAELEDAQLGETEADLLGWFQEIRAGKAVDEKGDAIASDDLGRLREAATAVEHIRAEAGRRYEVAAADAAEAQARAEEAAALEAELLADPETAETAETPTEPESPEDPEKPEEPETPSAPVVAEETPAEEPAAPVEAPPAEAVAAASQPPRPSLARLAAARPPAAAPAAPIVTRPRWESLNPREPVRNMDEAAERILAASEELVATAPGVTFKRPVVRVFADYPEDRMMREGDVRGNTRKLMALTEGSQDPETWTDPIVASGGWCAPLEPRYDVMTIAEAHRPFRDGLPNTGAERGGIRVIGGLGIEGVTTGGPTTANAAVGIWTADLDETPGENTKGRAAIACPTPVDVELQAIYWHRRVGNFQGRSWPELIAAEMRRTMAAHARVAETELLDCVCDASLTITEPQFYGAARDILTAVAQARAQMVSRQRIGTDTRMRVWLPFWVLALMQADVTRQQASGEVESLGVTEEQIRGWLSARGVNVGFYVDGMTSGSGVWGDIADNTSLRNWPSTVQWMMHPEGSFLFLDGGTLDLGVYRDGTLIGTNDYAIFAETFENCAFVGISDAAICVTQTLCADGDSQLPTVNTPCTAS